MADLASESNTDSVPLPSTQRNSSNVKVGVATPPFVKATPSDLPQGQQQQGLFVSDYLEPSDFAKKSNNCHSLELMLAQASLTTAPLDLEIAESDVARILVKLAFKQDSNKQAIASASDDDSVEAEDSNTTLISQSLLASHGKIDERRKLSKRWKQKIFSRRGISTNPSRIVLDAAINPISLSQTVWQHHDGEQADAGCDHRQDLPSVTMTTGSSATSCAKLPIADLIKHQRKEETLHESSIFKPCLPISSQDVVAKPMGDNLTTDLHSIRKRSANSSSSPSSPSRKRLCHFQCISSTDPQETEHDRSVKKHRTESNTAERFKNLALDASAQDANDTSIRRDSHPLGVNLNSLLASSSIGRRVWLSNDDTVTSILSSMKETTHPTTATPDNLMSIQRNSHAQGDGRAICSLSSHCLLDDSGVTSTTRHGLGCNGHIETSVNYEYSTIAPAQGTTTPNVAKGVSQQHDEFNTALRTNSDGFDEPHTDSSWSSLTVQRILQRIRTLQTEEQDRLESKLMETALVLFKDNLHLANQQTVLESLRRQLQSRQEHQQQQLMAILLNKNGQVNTTRFSVFAQLLAENFALGTQGDTGVPQQLGLE